MRYFVLFLSIFVCFAGLHADEAIYDASLDTEVDEELSTINFGAEPAIEVYADWEDEPVWTVKALFLFPVDLPTGAVIDEAVLQLHVLDRSTDPGPLNIFRANGPWTEMSVTWDTRPGENRDIMVSENAPEVIINPELWEIDVTDIVQSWADGFPNNGFYLDVPDNNNWVDVDLATKENPDPGIRPHLWVNYHTGGACEEVASNQVSLDVSGVCPSRVDINYFVPSFSNVSLCIYDASGALVENLEVSSGDHSITWNGNPGVYFIKLQSIGKSISSKAVVLR
ncbi:DNRLRE domain-containing protein [candidate division WOR-3 bacterium]|nr:DNRLRE domain-containing protein [candidate division WOR-3 bacterium]